MGPIPETSQQSHSAQCSIRKFCLLAVLLMAAIGGAIFLWAKREPAMLPAGEVISSHDAETPAPSSEEPAPTSVEPLDLTAYYQTPASRLTGGRYPWGTVPRGQQTFGNVPLSIDGRMCLWGATNTKNGQVFPQQIPDITVNRKFPTLYIYHATFHRSEEGAPVYRLTMNYADGTSSQHTICYGTHVRDWYQYASEPVSELSDANSKIVWRGDQPDSTPENPKKLRFFITSLANPEPAREVTSIDLTTMKGQSAGCIMAMTTGPADLLKADVAAGLSSEE